MPYLAQVADLLTQDPSQKPTAAMKRVMKSYRDQKETDETLLRRWQAKWQAGKNVLLAEAHERAHPKRTITLAEIVEATQQFHEGLVAFQRRVEEITRQPGFRRFLDGLATWQKIAERNQLQKSNF